MTNEEAIKYLKAVIIPRCTSMREFELWAKIVNELKQPQIIKCKDCIYWRSGNELCCCESNCNGNVACMVAKADDFCSKAEKREE